MAKHSSNILELAARGAKHRYDELQAEIASLIRQFPGLRKTATTTLKRGRKAVAAATAEFQPQKRRKMSAKARAAISAAQKARWAKHKAGAKK